MISRLSGYLLSSLLLFALASCGPTDRTASDPSPGAMADAPPPEALDSHPPPSLEETRAEFQRAMQYATEQQLLGRPIGEMMIALGRQYIGRPYIIGPLDGFGREVLVARLDSFDCFTYVEALMAMARGIAEGDTTFEGYLQRTEEQRYREGRMLDYCSRLHYFTDWIHTNTGRGLLTDITEAVGGEPFPHRYSFMTEHRDAYPALAEDDAFACIQRVENDLNATVRLFYIPQDRINQSYRMLLPGDLLSMSTHIDGLDVTHTGLAYPNGDGSFGLLHASTDGGVKISPDLQEYVQSIRVQNGIIVARPLDSRR
jgi:cell wall-associated NlpC family hydrolase